MLLGLHISEDLPSALHIDANIKKAHQHRYFSGRLRRFGLLTNTLLIFYWCKQQPGAGLFVDYTRDQLLELQPPRPAGFASVTSEIPKELRRKYRGVKRHAEKRRHVSLYLII
ncbi:uncharacterized protein LOC144609694 [Rhinoraja longicauda]